MQRFLEELKQHILALKQEPHAPEESNISDSEMVSEGDDECYETAGSHLLARLIVQQK